MRKLSMKLLEEVDQIRDKQDIKIYKKDILKTLDTISNSIRIDYDEILSISLYKSTLQSLDALCSFIDKIAMTAFAISFFYHMSYRGETSIELFKEYFYYIIPVNNYWNITRRTKHKAFYATHKYRIELFLQNTKLMYLGIIHKLLDGFFVFSLSSKGTNDELNLTQKKEIFCDIEANYPELTNRLFDVMPSSIYSTLATSITNFLWIGYLSLTTWLWFLQKRVTLKELEYAYRSNLKEAIRKLSTCLEDNIDNSYLFLIAEIITKHDKTMIRQSNESLQRILSTTSSPSKDLVKLTATRKCFLYLLRLLHITLLSIATIKGLTLTNPNSYSDIHHIAAWELTKMVIISIELYLRRSMIV